MDDMLKALDFPTANTWVLNVAPDYSLELIICDGMPQIDKEGRAFRRTFICQGTGSSPFTEANTCNPLNSQTMNRVNDILCKRGDPTKGESVMAGFKNSPCMKIVHSEHQYNIFIDYLQKKGLNPIQVADGGRTPVLLDEMIGELGFPPSEAWVLNVDSFYNMELIICDGSPQFDAIGNSFRYTISRSGFGYSPFSTG